MKTIEEFIKNSGWSSHLFLDKAKLFFIYCEKNNVNLIILRSVIYIEKNSKKYKLYVHKNKKSNQFLSICDTKGNELYIFHYSVNFIEIETILNKLFVEN